MVKTRLRAEIGGDQRKQPSKDSYAITLGGDTALICVCRGGRISAIDNQSSNGDQQTVISDQGLRSQGLMPTKKKKRNLF